MLQPVSETARWCEDKIEIAETDRSARGASLAIRSSCPVPLTVEVNLHSMLNLQADRERPIRVFLEPGAERVPLVELTALQRGAAWSYGIQYRAVVGHVPARHDDSYRYAFPFGGSEPRLCGQGPHEKPSHMGVAAYDFEMPIGTPVVAAREGIVVGTVDAFDDAGSIEDARFLERANAVTILHEDDTTATYAHLRRGIVVAAGERVGVGQLLGYSGNSGYSGGPHLHFEVEIPDFDRAETVAIRFVGDTVATRGIAYPPTSSTETPAREHSRAGLTP